jgi:hypothetical protein
MKSKGLGDTVEKITTFTGIKKLAEGLAKIAGVEGCGCNERKAILNELFPYEDTSRNFKVLEEFNIRNNTYFKGEVIDVSKKDRLFPELIKLVESKRLEEL